MKINLDLLIELKKILNFTLAIYIEHKAPKDDINHIVDVIRKIELTILFQEKDIFAIGGTQGAGKTTLVKEMLAIPDGWLEGNPGRGEQVPLFIEQSNDKSLTEPKAVFVCLEKETRSIVEKDNITKEELKHVLQGWEHFNTAFSDENLSIIYPKLYIPCSNTFIKEKLNWVLLPGYEKSNSRNYHWQNLMRYIFVNASGMIITTDNALLANSNQNNIMQDLSCFLAERSPVVAVTKTENMQQEDKIQLINTASTVFNKEYNERNKEVKTDNIVLTGYGNKDEWSSELEDAINKYIYSTSTTKTRLLDSFQEFLNEDLDKILSNLDNLKSNINYQHDEKMDLLEDILQKFDESVANYQNKLRKELRNKLHVHTQEAIDKCKEKYKEEEEGLANNLRILGRRFLCEGAEIQRERWQRVKIAWNEEFNNENINIKMITGNVITELNGSEFRKNGFIVNKIDNLLIEDQSVSITQLLNYSSDMSEDIPKKEIPLKILQSYLYGKREALDDLSAKDKELAIKLIPVLAMEFARSNLIITGRNKIDTNHANEINPQTFLNALFDGSKQVTPIRNSMLALLGLDLLDGELDGTYDPTKETKFSPIAILGKAALAISAAYTLYQITSIIRESDQMQIKFIESAMMNIEMSYIQSIINDYDDAMENIREIIKNNVKDLYEIPDGIFQKSDILLAKTRLEGAKKAFQGYLVNAKNILA